MTIAVLCLHDVSSLRIGKSIPLELEEKHHLKVKRCRDGEKISIHDGRGGYGIGEFRGGEVILLEIVPETPPMIPELHLCIGQFDVRHFEWLLEKATELGIRSIQPFKSDRVDAGNSAEADRKRARHEKILAESMKQSGQRHVPTLKIVRDLSQLVETQRSESTATIVGQQFVAVEPTPGTSNKTKETGQKRPIVKSGESCTLWVGPEGGWSPEDLKLLESMNPHWLTMPGAVFRAETAALFFASLILYPYK